MIRVTSIFSVAALFCATGAMPVQAQLRAKKMYLPAGDKLERALRSSVLGQKGAHPFHIRFEIGQTSGEHGDYSAVIEERWFSQDRWVRTVTASQLKQTTVRDDTGQHFLTEGTYFPSWLRNFVTAISDPVPAMLSHVLGNAKIEYAEFSNGIRSTPCQHVEVTLGSPPARQVNFVDVCFRSADALLELATSPAYGMQFADYEDFDGLKFPKMLIGRGGAPGVRLAAKITTLENLYETQSGLAVPVGAVSEDPWEAIYLSTDDLQILAGGMPKLQPPKDTTEHGMFTVWVSIDRDGVVREARPLNSDNSEISSSMAAQLIGLRWKPFVQNRRSVQAQGPLVFAY